MIKVLKRLFSHDTTVEVRWSRAGGPRPVPRDYKR